MDMLLPPMARLPFGHILSAGFGWPGAALLTVIGLPHFIAAAMVLRRHRLAPQALLVAGGILVAWLMLQLVVLYGPNWMTNLYLIFAIIEIAAALLWWRSRSRAELRTREELPYI